MNFGGVVRRVDELGRIVIPVEIRRILNIKVGENLEFIIKNNIIELRKKSMVQNSISLLNEISDKLSEIIDGDFFITDREKILLSTNKLIQEKKLNNELSNLLSVHEDTELINSTLMFEDIFIQSSFYIFPYYVENDIAGFIGLYNVSNKDIYSRLIKFICSYVHDKLSL